MPLIIQKEWYTRQQIRDNPDTLYVWGDNLARVGGANNPKSGQAFACRDEPNAIGIPTKKEPSMGEHAFFSDADFDLVRPIIDSAFLKLATHLHKGGTVVWPADGIGTGRAELEKRAPRIWRFLENNRNSLASFANSLK